MSQPVKYVCVICRTKMAEPGTAEARGRQRLAHRSCAEFVDAHRATLLQALPIRPAELAKVKAKQERLCEHCFRPTDDLRRRLHTGCEQFVIRDTANKAERKRVRDARSRRLRRNGLVAPGPDSAPPVAAPESPSTPPPVPPCDFCGWVHGNGQEARECRARAERANRDLADLRKRRVQ